MPAAPLIDSQAERVGALVRNAFVLALGDRLVALLAHGSAVTGGYIAGFSDFDVVLFTRGALTTEDSTALQRQLGETDHAPFAYLQVSRVIDLDEPPPAEDRRSLIDGAYASLVGDHPPDWLFHDAETLGNNGDEVLDGLPSVLASRRKDWSVASGERRRRELRYQLTQLKPSVRALLVQLGEPVLEVWTASYPELARRWTRREPALGNRFARLLERLPPETADEATTGEEMLALLDVIAAHPR